MHPILENIWPPSKEEIVNKICNENWCRWDALLSSEKEINRLNGTDPPRGIRYFSDGKFQILIYTKDFIVFQYEELSFETVYWNPEAFL